MSKLECGLQVCCDSTKWKQLIQQHEMRSKELVHGELPTHKALLWNAIGNEAGGLAWEIRYLLLAFLTALATNQVLTLGFPLHEKYELPLVLPSPLITGGYSPRDKSVEAETYRNSIRTMVYHAKEQNIANFRWHEAECWILGAPYQSGPISTHPHCISAPEMPVWFQNFQSMLSGPSGLSHEYWLGCAFQAIVKLNLTLVKEKLPNKYNSLLNHKPKKEEEEEEMNYFENVLINTEDPVNLLTNNIHKNKTNNRLIKNIMIHIRSGSSDFGKSYEKEIDLLIHSNGLEDLNIAHPFKPLQLMSDEPINNNNKHIKMLSPNFIEETRRHNIFTAVRSAKLAIHCAKQLTSSLHTQFLSETKQKEDVDRVSIRWSIASDSPAIVSFINKTANSIPDVEVYTSFGAQDGLEGERRIEPLHHTKVRDKQSGLGDLEAAIEFMSMGESKDVFIAGYSSIVRAGSAFACLSAVKGNVPLVFVLNGLSDSSKAQCDWRGSTATTKYIYH